MAEESSPIANTEKPLFEIDLGPEIGVFAPRSIDELEQWQRVETDTWSWLRSQNVPDTNRQTHHEQEIANWIDQIKRNDGSKRNLLSEITVSLQARYQNYSALYSAGPRAKFVSTLGKTRVAAYAVRAMLGLPMTNVGEAESLKGNVAAFLYEFGLQGVPQSQEQSWQDLVRVAKVDRNALRTEAGKLADRFRTVKGEIETLHTEQERLFTEQQAARATAYEGLVNSHAVQMADIAKAFKEEMKLKVSVQYFEDKATQHTAGRNWRGGACLVVGALFVGAAAAVAMEVFDASKPPPWYEVATLALAGTLMFWLLRILVRMFLSDLHLATDMRSRAVLLQSYLALMSEGGAVKDEDRKLILQLLFRPISDGLVRDDGAPAGPWDLVTRLLGGAGR